VTAQRQIALSAFASNGPVQTSLGTWRDPRNETHRYTSTAYRVELAQLLERGLFDTVFIGDALGVYETYGGSRDAALHHAAFFPINDPTMVISAMAHATAHLGFAVTGSVLFEPPAPFARRSTI
jgi:alkanesulfonate monooxygenase SsuD/methylene tetrahydromethanopterin reductase-like flavin-dependent oxidoreductase (luciferase family)